MKKQLLVGRRGIDALVLTLLCGGAFPQTPPEAGGGRSPGEVKVNPKDGLKYVWIAPGAFTMGARLGIARAGNLKSQRTR